MKMNTEAKIIEQVLGRFKAHCRVVAPPASYQTSRHSVYGLQRADHVRIEKVVELGDEVDEALTSAFGRRVRVRFLRSPLAIMVPRQDQQIIPASDIFRQCQKSTGLVLPLGYHFDHDKSLTRDGVTGPELLAVDLIVHPHVLVAGSTNCGKTILLEDMILGMGVTCAPSKVSFILIDGKSVNLPILGDLPHLAHPVVTDAKDALLVLNAVVAEMDYRRERYNELEKRYSPEQMAACRDQLFSPNLVVFIDEVAELIDVCGDTVEYNIKRLVQAGRQLGIHVVMATQKPEAKIISGVTMSNVPVRICGLVAAPEQGKYITGMPGNRLGAHRLTGRGEFLMTLNASNVYPFICGYIEPGSEAKIAKAIAGNWWKGEQSSFRLNMSRVSDRVEQDTATEQPRRQSLPAPLPSSNGKDAVQSRHASLQEKILAHAQATNSLPSANWVCSQYQQLFGSALNYVTAKKLLARAGQMLEQ